MVNPSLPSLHGAQSTPGLEVRSVIAVTPGSASRARVGLGRRDNYLSRIISFPARTAGGLIWLYQKTVSPALVVLNPTCGCRFVPTCSQYARDALTEHGLVSGFFLTLRRLVKCGPWHAGGEDPVPLRPRRVCTKVSPV